MGRNSKSKSSRNKAKLKKIKNQGSTTEAAAQTGQKYSIDQLLEKATEAQDTFNYEIAQKFCQRALEIEPDNLKALETSGHLLLELGNVDGAKHCFGRALELSPESGHSKYMYLGQLFTGAESVQCFQKGIDLMLAEKAKQQETELSACAASSKASKISDRDISNAYCSIAELYMTDCCDDEDAENHCRQTIEKAISTDNHNPEAYQLNASFLLVTQNLEEAKTMINKSVSLWLPKAKELDKASTKPPSGDGDKEDFDAVSPVALSFQTRLQTAQILTEVSEYETACDVLEGLLDENDEMVEVWHLLGWVNYQQGTDYYTNARHYLNKAKEVMKKTGDKDDDMLKHIDELLEKLGPGPSEESDDDRIENGGDQENIDDEADSESEAEAMDDS